MQYQTIVLEILESYPALSQKLAASNSLISTITTLAADLRQAHLLLIEELKTEMPTLSQLELSSMAAEMVIADLKSLIWIQAEVDQ